MIKTGEFSSEAYKTLKWDSEFFGFKVAKIIPPRLNSKKLRQLLKVLTVNSVRLAYWPSDSQDKKSRRAALSMGGFLADKKVTYLIDFKKRNVRSSEPSEIITAYDQRKPSKDLLNLAWISGKYSRFRLDSRIPTAKFRTLYRLWMEKSIEGKLAKAVLVYPEKNHLVGMVTVGAKNGTGSIGLIAVHPLFGGRGIGSSLVKAANHWFQTRGYSRAEVVTQLKNIAACRLYENCGYKMKKVENFFHFWL